MRVAIVLRYLWSAPNTLLGLTLVMLSCPRPGAVRWSDGVLELTGGAVSRVLAAWPFRASAISIGHVIIARDEAALILSRRHERAHVRQYEKFGPFMLPAYALAGLFALIRGGHPYRDNYFERQANR